MADDHQTIEQMWNEFLRSATRHRPGRKVPEEVRPAYYTGCFDMMHKMITMMRQGEDDASTWAATWKKWGDELSQYSKDYNEGKI